MICPYCGGSMQHGEILSRSDILQWIETEEPVSKAKKYTSLGLEGKMLLVPSTLGRAWIPADYCPKCKKMIFETEILDV